MKIGKITIEQKTPPENKSQTLLGMVSMVITLSVLAWAFLWAITS